MLRRSATLFFWVLLGIACTPSPEVRRAMALDKVRQSPSSLPGLSVEQAVVQVLSDMRSSKKIHLQDGKWYCNVAIEQDAEAYKVGYEFTQNGKSARFAWIYRYDAEKVEALNDYARQVRP